jgi:hypothetical protein
MLHQPECKTQTHLCMVSCGIWSFCLKTTNT